jgi:hypothetical protein
MTSARKTKVQAPYLGYDADGTLTSEYGVPGGDSDCSTYVDFDDINYFVAALAGGEDGWTDYYKAHHDQQYPPCPFLNNDANNDSVVDFDDINPFVALLVHGAGDTARLYYYDAENRLSEFNLLADGQIAVREQYGYDYLGRRVFKQVDIFVSGNPVTIEKRRFIWDGWKLLEELNGKSSDAVVRKYTWGLDLAGLNGQASSLEAAGGIGDAGRGDPALQGAGGLKDGRS